MNAMPAALRGFAITIVILWIAGTIGGILYAQQQHIPASVTVAVLPAILVEIAFYTGTVMESSRRWFERLGPKLVRAPLSVVSAVLPFVIYAAPLGILHQRPLLTLAALAAVVAFWFVILPRQGWSTVLLLAFLGAVVEWKLFPALYPRPSAALRVDFLGQMMWFRLGILSFVSFAEMRSIRLGFLPDRGEWLTGAKWFVLFLPVAWVANWLIGFAHYRPSILPEWQAAALAVGTFAGVLWVVALGEEFFFRGVLQPLMTKWMGSAGGLVLTSLLFGSVHLWFRQFPNWRMAALAALAGVFYGLAFREAGGIRAAMVTHALVVTTWRTFFV
jgi:membrane protease YdiL (CAAX protease family)